MQGKNRFTTNEAQKIKELLRAKERADRSGQKIIRNKLRKIRFYITDFDTSQVGFTENDFDNLIKVGRIKIIIGDSYTSNVNHTIPTQYEDSKAQEVRQLYKPKKVNVLFVGESPPVGGTFFYYANSNLFSCISKAFNQVYDKKMGEGVEFLKSFSKLNCYLDDLCLQPINNLTDSERIQMRDEGVVPLSKRIKLMNPKAIIVVMRAIELDVLKAVKNSGLSSIILKTTTFPAFSEINKSRCLSENANVVNNLIQLNILPSGLDI